MTTVLLEQNLGEEENRVARTKGIPGIVIHTYQTTLKINGMKGVKHVAVLSHFIR